MPQPTNEIVIADEAPGATPSPSISIGEVIRYLPIIEQVIQAIKSAIASGQFTLPVLKIRVGGKRLELGPCPIVVKS